MGLCAGFLEASSRGQALYSDPKAPQEQINEQGELVTGVKVITSADSFTDKYQRLADHYRHLDLLSNVGQLHPTLSDLSL